jgi:hypothetical protein
VSPPAMESVLRAAYPAATPRAAADSRRRGAPSGLMILHKSRRHRSMARSTLLTLGSMLWRMKPRSRRARVAAEFEDVSLGDPRRERRARVIAERLTSAPDASLPEAMGDPSALEALYRHLSTPEIDLDQLLRHHVEQSVARVEDAGEAYAISDTTGAKFGGKSKRKGLGHVDSLFDQGFRAHLTLAVSIDGSRTPLGLLAVGTRSRLGDDPVTHNEADRWGIGMDMAAAHFAPHQLIHVADRESDIFVLLAQARAQQWRFIFRASYDRKLVTEHPEDVSRLFAAIAQREAMFELDVPVSRRGKQSTPKQRKAFPAREARIATVCFRAASVRIKRSSEISAKDGPPYVEVNVVHVWEPDPPADETAVDWLLYTSEPISSRSKVKAVVEGYRTRWVIEEYIKVIKTGCAFESRQLESAHSLLNLFAYCLIIAYAMLVMRSDSRDAEALSASLVFTQPQLKCLRLLSRRKLPRHPTLREALLRVAALGGHLKNNGDPGWQTLSRGWRKINDGAALLELAQNL